MKEGLWIGMGLVLMSAMVCSCALVEDQGRPAIIVEVVNRVDAHPHPKDDWQPAETDMAVYGGGQVRTGSASSARLELLEGVVRLTAETLFTVKESTTRQERLETTLFLQEGRLWLHLASDEPHEFTVETGNAVAAVRDTHFSVRVDPDQTTLVSVAKGEVELRAQEQTVIVTAGEQATVEPGRPPAPPELMSEEELTLWVAEAERFVIEDFERILPTPTPTLTPMPVPTATPAGAPIEWGIDRRGGDYSDFDLPEADPVLCQNACAKDPQCKAWTYVKPDTLQGPLPRCWLKNTVPPPIQHDCCVSGVKVED